MSEFETKPNQGRAWETSQEQKVEKHEFLSKYDWYNPLSKEEKQGLIPLWKGFVEPEIDGVVKKLGIEICQNTTKAGKPQLTMKTWVMAPSSQGSSASGRSSTEQNADPFADIFE